MYGAPFILGGYWRGLTSALEETIASPSHPLEPSLSGTRQPGSTGQDSRDEVEGFGRYPAQSQYSSNKSRLAGSARLNARPT